MNRRTRRAINLLASHIEDAAAALVGWLRAKAERKYRRRPFAFPSALELMMDELHRNMVRRYAQDVLATSERMWADIPYNAGGAPYVPNRIRVTSEADDSWKAV